MLEAISEFFEDFTGGELAIVVLVTAGIWLMIFKSPIWADSLYFTAKPYMLWIIAAVVPIMAIIAVKLIRR